MQSKHTKIIVTGLPGSGKIIIIKSLDGHSNIISIPTHDKLLSPFFERDLKNIKKASDAFFGDISLNNNFKKKYIKFRNKKLNFIISPYFIRYLLSLSGYYITEQFSFFKRITDDSSNDAKKIENFNFDYYQYERLWKEKILNSNEDLSVENFIDIFLKSYYMSWNNKEKKILENKIFSIMGPNNALELFKFISSENFNAKIIFVQRDLYGLFITNCLREFRRKININSDLSFDDIIIEKLSGDYIKNQKKVIDEIFEYERKFPDLIKIINVKTYIEKIDEQSKDLCKFLNIKFEKILTQPTHYEKLLDKRYFNQMNDDTYKIDPHLKKYIDIKIKGLNVTFNLIKNFNLNILKIHILVIRKNILNKRIFKFLHKKIL